ncbi:MAG: MBL fold metallo-hydrolase [Candidatus Syntrophosphaera sp.]
MKITICYDNTSINAELTPDWGFSCFVEADGRKILFDTGGNGRILLDNLRKLDIDPGSFDDIFISHPDFDHIGGLSHILNLNERAVLHNPTSFRGVKYANPVKFYDLPAKIYANFYTTGELGQREQSLAVRTNKGIVVIIGCGHPGLGLILNTVTDLGRSLPPPDGFEGIYAVVGGLHGFTEYEVLEDVSKVCPTHCTRHMAEIQALYPDKYIPGGVGQAIEF